MTTEKSPGELIVARMKEVRDQSQLGQIRREILATRFEGDRELIRQAWLQLGDAFDRDHRNDDVDVHLKG